jgi:hypothetical protein
MTAMLGAPSGTPDPEARIEKDVQIRAGQDGGRDVSPSRNRRLAQAYELAMIAGYFSTPLWISCHIVQVIIHFKSPKFFSDVPAAVVDRFGTT